MITKTNSDRSNEYEYKHLKFLDTLGEGAFGKVLKAEAVGLKCPQGSQMVAVKMCRGLLETLSSLFSNVGCVFTLNVIHFGNTVYQVLIDLD